MITPEQLGEVAKRLNMALHFDEERGFAVGNSGIGYMPISDGDLLLAILNRAAEMGYTLEVKYAPWFRPACGAWECVAEEAIEQGDQFALEYAATPLEAVALAFIQLPVQP